MNYQFFLFAVVLLLFGCASPRKSFEKGDYEKAFETTLTKAKNNKASQQDFKILYESLRFMVGQKMEEIRVAEQSNNPKELEYGLSLVKELKEHISEAKRYSELNFDENILELDDKEAEFSEILYGHYYKSGLYLLKRGERENNKPYVQNAFLDFEKAREFQTTIALDSLQAIALEKGLIHINVGASATFALEFDWEIDQVFDDIEWESDQFTKITYDDFGESEDCNIDVRFQDLGILTNDEIVEQNEYQQRVIVDYQTFTDSSGTREEPIYGTVYASLSVRRFTKLAVADVSIYIDGFGPNCQLEGTSFTRRLDAVVEEIRITGDERAVPAEYQNQPYRSFGDLPNDSQLMEELLQEIYSEFVRHYF